MNYKKRLDRDHILEGTARLGAVFIDFLTETRIGRRVTNSVLISNALSSPKAITVLSSRISSALTKDPESPRLYELQDLRMSRMIADNAGRRIYRRIMKRPSFRAKASTQAKVLV